MFQDASVIILSNFSTSAVMGAVKFLVKYCISIVPDSCASATPEYVFCCPESPNKAMAVTLRRQQNMYTTYQYNKSKIPQKKTTTPHICLVLPVRINPFGDYRLCVTFQQVPYVEVRGCIKHTEDCWSGLRPLQRDHRFTRCTILPLCHRLLVADCMQPDAAIPTSHLEYVKKVSKYKI